MVTSVTEHLVDVIRSEQGINMLYVTEKINLLVFIATNGNIFATHLHERNGEDHLKWSISTTEAGISANDVDKLPSTNVYQSLRNTHIIFFGIKDTGVGRLTQMYENLPLTFKQRLQNAKGMSKLIKDTMKAQNEHPVEVIQQSTKSINALYTTTDIYILVFIDKNGDIFGVRLYERQGEDSEWYISTTDAGINAEKIEECTSEEALLRYTHIISLKKGAHTDLLIKIYTNFMSKLKRWDVRSLEDLSRLIKKIMKEKHPIVVQCGESKGSVVADYETDGIEKLHLDVGSEGKIISVYLWK